jgi:hypothetical protein
MKRVLLVILMLALLAGLAFGQDKKPTAAVSLELFGGIFAPIGVGAEFFLGPVGLGVELRGLFFGVEETFIGTVEPGATVRFYFSDLDSSMYLMGGCSYVTGWAISEGEASGADFGILKPKAGVGYNALFGKSNKTRFAIELGAVYTQWVVSGNTIEGMPFNLLPHLLLMFGRVF